MVKHDIILRQLQASDTEQIAITFQFTWTSFEQNIKKWNQYYKEQQDNIRFVCVVEKANKLIGYGSLLYISKYSYFSDHKISEINDIWILQDERKKGLGAMLIKYLEDIARAKFYTQIGLGVGLYSDYGAAQRLYCKLGYLPDGNGITYKNIAVVPGKKYTIDDDLVLWLIKSL